jgi:CO/xanthine dehydrogenase FAD-binding subunit
MRGATVQDFDYARPANESEVIALLSGDQDAVHILGGGTDLIPQLREGRRRADLVVDIKQVPAATELIYDPLSGLRLGAGVPCYRICSDPTIARVYPGLVEAMGLIGGTQIQNRATVGGNLCNASPAADSIPALIAHRAVCIIAGRAGRREVPVEGFCIAPGKTVLERGEFLLAVYIPPPEPRFGAAYLRFTPRNEMDIAVCGAGVSLTLDSTFTKFESVVIALGAVGPTPLLATEAGDYLRDRFITEDNLAEAARVAQALAQPITDMRGTTEQRKHLSAVLTRRALERAVARAKTNT